MSVSSVDDLMDALLREPGGGGDLALGQPGFRRVTNELVSPFRRCSRASDCSGESGFPSAHLTSRLVRDTENGPAVREHPGPGTGGVAPMQRKRSQHEGIEIRHSRSCQSRAGEACACKPTFQASVWSRREKKRIRKTFPTVAAARAWRQDSQVAVRRGTMRAPSPKTVEQAAGDWLRGLKEGSVRNRSGDPYKPSVIRSYEASLRLHVLPEVGGFRLSDLGHNSVQDLADLLSAKDLDPSTVRNAINPLRAMYRRAVSRGEVAVNPTAGIELPAVRGRRDRFASPSEARELLDAVPVEDRAIWATALFAGLRLGELRALRWEDVTFSEALIRVERSWDAREGAIDPKSRAGARSTPIPTVLRDELLKHKVRSGRRSGLAFGRTETQPFQPTSVQGRAERAWRAAGLARITMHECRHTFASLMIAAGVNAKALSTFMGHSDIAITLNRYGHLMPGSEIEAASLLDAFLERSVAVGGGI